MFPFFLSIGTTDGNAEVEERAERKLPLRVVAFAVQFPKGKNRTPDSEVKQEVFGAYMLHFSQVHNEAFLASSLC